MQTVPYKNLIFTRTKHRDFIPARTSPGKTRPALPAKTQGGSAKSAMGGAVTLRVGSVNVGTMRGREGGGREVGDGVGRHGNSVLRMT